MLSVYLERKEKCNALEKEIGNVINWLTFFQEHHGTKRQNAVVIL